MFADVRRLRIVLLVALIPLTLLALFSLRLRENQFSRSREPVSAGLGAGPVEAMQRSLARDRTLLAEAERDQAVLRAEVIKRRKLFQDGQISKEQVGQAERAFVAALRRVHALRESVIETDIAITEAVLGQKVARLPVLPPDGYSETAELARFNGSSKWSLREAPRLEKYFAQRFGRSLPIAARGQSETHNRFGFDHRDALDVALHPDSAEGKILIGELRKAGIPFIAFRGAVPGVSTGPHIHVGRPSGRLAH